MLSHNSIIKEFPSLFRRAGDHMSFGGFDCGPGWLTLVRVACLSIDWERNRAQDKIDRGVKAGVSPTVEELQATYDETVWPAIAQIKEKYGTLRFYADHTTDREECFVEFAETLSGFICEVCGAPGIQRSGSWIKTTCDEHTKTD